MKRPGSKVSASRRIALALTWDGARWPARSLPLKARDFLGVKEGKPFRAQVPSTQELAKLFADGQVSEIRICWVPRLKGGSEVLSEPFEATTGKRIGFQVVKTARMWDMLGVVYRCEEGAGRSAAVIPKIFYRSSMPRGGIDSFTKQLRTKCA